MTALPEPVTGELILLIDPHAARDKMLALTAVLALRGPVRVIDGGNHFDAYQVARHIRRQTPHVDEALEHIAIARASTCYQVVRLLTETAVTTAPQLAFDLLTTFYNENVTAAESQRLLHIAIDQLQRLRQQAPLVISVRPPQQPARINLVRSLMAIADHILMRQTPAQPPSVQLF